MKSSACAGAPTVINQSATRLIRLPEILKRSGRSRSAHYRDIQFGVFPAAVKIGARASAWPEAEVEQILRAQIAGATIPQLRELVTRIVASRGELAIASVSNRGDEEVRPPAMALAVNRAVRRMREAR